MGVNELSKGFHGLLKGLNGLPMGLNGLAEPMGEVDLRPGAKGFAMCIMLIIQHVIYGQVSVAVV